MTRSGERRNGMSSDSSLVDVVMISPYRTVPRNHKIDTITIHFVWSFRIIRGLSSAEIMVINEIVIEIYPA